MMTVYTLVNDRLVKAGPEALSAAALWVDLLQPTPEEEEAVERLLGIDVPTREEMEEIEASSRLYREDGAAFATTPIVVNSDSAHPESTAVTFILTRICLVTVRYGDPKPFATFAARAMRQRGLCPTPDAVTVGLLEAITDRVADVLERIGAELDALSRDIFRLPGEPKPRGWRRLGRARAGTDLQELLRAVGRHGDLTSKVRDSLLGLGRVASFLGQGDDGLTRKEVRPRIKTLGRDLRSLSEHAAFLSAKINFLLDATLGMISIQQNNIIKIFSVVAVVFLPPTLIASIYGMNFAFMPELSWPWGYPFALALMLMSAILPYLYFKRRGWL